MIHFAQSVPLDLLHDLGTFGWAVVLVVLWFVWRELGTIKESMVTKDGLTIALGQVREELEKHVADRFQTKELCATQHEKIYRAINGQREGDSD